MNVFDDVLLRDNPVVASSQRAVVSTFRLAHSGSGVAISEAGDGDDCYSWAHMHTRTLVHNSLQG